MWWETWEGMSVGWEVTVVAASETTGTHRDGWMREVRMMARDMAIPRGLGVRRDILAVRDGPPVKYLARSQVEMRKY